MLIAIQYLQPEPDLDSLSPSDVREKLHAAGEILPITHVLIGWNIPPRLLEACRVETRRIGAKLFRWQPLLTEDGVLRFLKEWRLRNMNDQLIGGYQNADSFTFACPNHPSVLDDIQENLEKSIKENPYDGFFLDRIRFCGLGNDLIKNLSCFCEYCRRKATDQGLDLLQVKDEIVHMAQSGEGRIQIMRALLNLDQNQKSAAEPKLLERFLVFRQNSITRLIQIVSEQLVHAGLQIGLDCFSPILTKMVGQDLHRLSMSANWVKVMTYAHVNAPAGIPYELMGLLDWLAQAGMDERSAIMELGKAAQIKLPSNRLELIRNGLSADCLRSEVSRALLMSGSSVLAGIELVDVPDVAQVDDKQIRADIRAMLSTGPAGMALCWDLKNIPLQRLKLVSEEIDRHPSSSLSCWH